MIHKRRCRADKRNGYTYKSDKITLDLVLDKRYDALFADECDMAYPWEAKKRTKRMVLHDKQREVVGKIKRGFSEVNGKIRELRSFGFIQAYALPDGRELRNVLACMVNIRPV